MRESDRRALEVRAILVGFRDARRTGETLGWDARARERLRQRASALLASVAVKIEPERDPELARLLDDARTEVHRLA